MGVFRLEVVADLGTMLVQGQQAGTIAFATKNPKAAIVGWALDLLK